MNYKITILPGDGIGQDITVEAKKILDIVAKKFDISFSFDYGLIGGVAIDETGWPLPEDTVKKCENCDAVLLGAVGGPKWDNLGDKRRPEAGLLGIRKKLGLFANLRPAVLFDPLKESCLLKKETTQKGLDILIIRELTGGIYFGKRGFIGKDTAFDTMIYSKDEVKRIAKLAFETAKKRASKLTSVDKANVLESSRLWRKCVIETSLNYPEVKLNHMYVDNAAMQLVRDPSQFDCLVTGNMFGDILSDEVSMITGSIGMLPSASLRGDSFGLYEPIHGSAPDIAGKNIANPLATILSLSMMFKYSFNNSEVASLIDKAVLSVLEKGYRSADIFSDGKKMVGTSQMGDLVKNEIEGL